MELRVVESLPRPRSTPGGRRTCGDCHLCRRAHPTTPEEPPTDTLFVPRHLVLEITNQCNMDCIMCERRMVRPDDLMPSAVIACLADGFMAHHTSVELSGLGEPTLAANFPEAARRVAGLGKTLYFPTNGTGLLRPPVLGALGNTRDVHVAVSIDAATAATYSRVRVLKSGRPTDWGGLIDTLREFRRRRPDVWLQSNFTAGAYNVDEFPDFVELMGELNFNAVGFKPVRCWTLKPEEASLRFRKTRTETAIGRGVELAEILGLELHVERPPYADSLEDAGEIPGFTTYLDIIPLGGGIECPVSTKSGTHPGSDPRTTGGGVPPDTSPEGETPIHGGSVDEPTIVRAPRRSRSVPVSDTLMALTDGTLVTCGAKHVLGHVTTHTWEMVVGDPEYQRHLWARNVLRDPNASKWCLGCERMM